MEQLKDRINNNEIKNRIDAKWKVIHDLESEYELRTNISLTQSRSELGAHLGKSFGTRRDLYKVLGYNKEPSFDDFYAKYKRQDIAKAVVDAPVLASWRLHPTIMENEEGTETNFETALAELMEESGAYHYLSRVDRISGIGRYAVLLMGFKDGRNLATEVRKGNQLLYLQPYHEDNAQIESLEEDTKNARYGKPLIYKIKLNSPNGNKTDTVRVHHSRILHVSEGLLESDTYGSSRLEPVLNRLHDLELILGGSAEMFWRGAFPGVGLAAKEGAYFSKDGQSLEALETEMDAYIHNMQRYFRVQDVEIHQMQTQVADPSMHVEIQLMAISASTGIPKRILSGSERGELASSQDETNWNTKMDERRTNYTAPMIIRPFLDRMIQVGILPTPSERYKINWPDLFVPSQIGKSLVTKTKAEAIAIYANSLTAQSIVPKEIFLREILGFTEQQINQANTSKTVPIVPVPAEITGI